VNETEAVDPTLRPPQSDLCSCTVSKLFTDRKPHLSHHKQAVRIMLPDKLHRGDSQFEQEVSVLLTSVAVRVPPAPRSHPERRSTTWSSWSGTLTVPRSFPWHSPASPWSARPGCSVPEAPDPSVSDLRYYDGEVGLPPTPRPSLN